MNPTNIEWTHRFGPKSGYTWNPLVGCSFGCPYCYARRQAKRHKHLCQQCYDFAPHLHPERLPQPLHRRKPAGIFLGSMSDLYGPEVPQEWRDLVWDICRQTPQHQYYVLTKQVQNVSDKPPDNVLLGFSCDDQTSFTGRASHIHLPSSRPIMVSVEPMHGPIHSLNGLMPHDWIIIGAQTGADAEAYAPHSDHAEALVGLAHECRIPVFVKDNLRNLYPERNWPQEWPGCAR